MTAKSALHRFKQYLLDAEPLFSAYVAESENVESIHNHSAYALIERDKAKLTLEAQ